MSATGTQASTYTAADVRKVVDNFAADFSMKAQATGLRTRESVAEVVSDLKTLAEQAFLVDVNLILKDPSGRKIRATVYTVSDAASGWTCGRPGGNLWPRSPGGALIVIATLGAAWWALTPDRKAAFISRHGLNSSWGLTAEDMTFAGLIPSPGQRYSSNGYGWERTNYA